MEVLRAEVVLFFSFLGKSEFRKLLNLCDKWDLVKFKTMLEEYLINDYENGFLHSFLSSKKDIYKSQHHMDIILMAEEYKLEKLHSLYMNKRPWLSSNGDKEIRVFKNMRDVTRYEIMKNTIIRRYGALVNRVDLSFVELKTIFSFFDLILYEDREVEMSVKKSFNNVWDRDDTFSKIRKQQRNVQVSNEFSTPQVGQKQIIFVMDTKRVYVEPFLVSHNSPVLTRMLQTARIEENGDVILSLSGKPYDGVLSLFKFLKNPLAEISKIFFCFYLHVVKKL